MDTNDLNIVNKTLYSAYVKNLKVRFFIEPLIFISVIILNYGNIIKGLPVLLIGLILLSSTLISAVFYFIIRDKPITLSSLKLGKLFNLILIFSEVIIFSIILPTIGDLFTPFLVVIFLEIVAAGILFKLVYSMILILLFFVIILMQISVKNIHPSDIFNISQENYFLYLIIYVLSISFVPWLVSFLLKPLMLDEKKIENIYQFNKDISLMKRKNQQITYLNLIVSEIVVAKNLNKILQYLVEGIRNVLDCGVVLLSLYDKSELKFYRAAHSGLTDEEWKKVKNQKINKTNLDKLLKEEFRIHGGYYIPGDYVNKIMEDKYVLSFEEEEQIQKSKVGHWSPDDILLFPIYGRDKVILGYFTVDKPKERLIPNEESLKELVLFINTATFAMQNIQDFEKVNLVNKKLKMVYTINSVITKLSQEENFLDKVVETISATLNYLNVAILLIDGDYLYVKSNKGYSQKLIKNLKIRVGYDGVTGWVAKWGIAQLVSDITKEPRYIAGIENVKSELAIPIKYSTISGKDYKEEILGVLDVSSEKIGGLTIDDQNLLTLITGQLAIALKNRELLHETSVLASTDGMTQLMNYRVFKENLYKEIKRAKRYDHTFSLLMIDIDDFKKVNDTYGHRAGDHVLKTLAEIMKDSVRDTDLVARYGGEEFTIIMPETEKDDAYLTGDRIRAIAEEAIVVKEETNEKIRFTISGGVASFPSDGDTFEKLVENVDIALYKAKKAGKNQIIRS